MGDRESSAKPKACRPCLPDHPSARLVASCSLSRASARRCAAPNEAGPLAAATRHRFDAGLGWAQERVARRRRHGEFNCSEHGSVNHSETGEAIATASGCRKGDRHGLGAASNKRRRIRRFTPSSSNTERARSRSTTLGRQRAGRTRVGAARRRTLQSSVENELQKRLQVLRIRLRHSAQPTG